MRILIVAAALALGFFALAPAAAAPQATPQSHDDFCAGVEGALDELNYDPVAAQQLDLFPNTATFCILRYVER